MFIDTAKIFVKSGKGGNGAVAFRREKFVPKGGPSGGNGGKGGDVIFIADRNLHTLLDFKYKKKCIAEDGAPGGSALKDGKNGQDIIVKVPVGTLIKDDQTDEVLADLTEDQQTVIIAFGGKGGKGNSNFATSTNQAPRKAESGKPGEEFYIELELKLIADVGLVGFPNAGKSTFISSVSAAKPKIADYPFTTLEPNLGIVKHKDFNTFVVADIPGIIEGAHQGKGLGHKFLQHIERTKILLILIDIAAEDYHKEYEILLNELNEYSEVLSEKKKIVAISKCDLLGDEEIKELSKIKFPEADKKVFFISSVSGKGIPKLLDYLWHQINS
ncbi:MAG: GTPase ObgE [Ignavibacteriales bacterium]|jgi:GTP-binding protein|nr:GTPase ObgE [Melioribacteraceae bacterium]RJP60829.1 MAG: GTPase ObgE [Ignavibacteriales bacterium]